MLALGLGACAAGEKAAYQDSAANPADRRAAAALVSELHQLEQRLAATLPASLEPDCVAARPLSKRICELAEHICVIAGRHPADRPLSQRCARSRQSCQRAQAQVATSCSGP